MGWLDNFSENNISAPEDNNGLTPINPINPNQIILDMIAHFINHGNTALTQQQQLAETTPRPNADMVASYLPPLKENEFTDIMSRLSNIPQNITAGNLASKLSGIESGGDYHATNPHSSATGKYQFLWNTWGDSIKKVTGVKSREEFLNSPQAQEDYYGYYKQNYLDPAVSRLRKYNRQGYTDDQLGELYHFKGEEGAKKWLISGEDTTADNNVSIPQYLSKGQTGGNMGVAVTPKAQHTGLNNPLYDELLFPMSGKNLFRGLDNKEPVHLTDASGKTAVLYGPHDVTVTNGTVKETRMNPWLEKYK